VAGLGEFVDGVDLPGEVVEPDPAAPLGRRGRADTEQAEVVVVARAGQPQERGVRPRFASGDEHAEDLGVELLGAGQVGDEQDRVVEADRVDAHDPLPVGPPPN